MSRATFAALAVNPSAVCLLTRSQLVDALQWNDPNGDYTEPQGEVGYMTVDQLCVALLIQVIDGLPS